MHPESLAELADSIKAQGVVQPIVVRALGAPDGGASQRYEIIAERTALARRADGGAHGDSGGHPPHPR